MENAVGINSITKLADEKFLLKMKDRRSFKILVDMIEANWGYSFNKNLKLNENSLEITIADVSEENLMRHLAVVSF